MAAAFFPDRYGIDLRARPRDHYRLWYHRDLSAAQLDRLLP